MKATEEQLYQLKLKKLIKLQEEEAKRNQLPHLYGWPWYKWAKEFFESRNPVTLLCAANQISKSSTQIRKCIDWATDMTKWDDLWGRRPNQFWYLYPSKEVATVEFEKKWVPEFMPRGEMKSDKVYGWRTDYDKKHIVAIHFNSGVSIYFKTYAQNPRTLQSGSVYAVFCFTAGHLVETVDGLKLIEDISIGDVVPTRQGTEELVQDVYKREAGVITRYLSNGEKLEGTPDHRVWTEKGYVTLQDLTSKDVLLISPSWQKKKREYLRERLTIDTQSQRIEGIGTLRPALGVDWTIYTRLFGRSIVVRYLRGMWFIIKMKISRTIGLLTWSLSQELSILGSTRKRSGLMGLLVKPVSLFASTVRNVLRLGRRKELLENIVHRPVEKRFMSRIGSVFTAVMNLWLEKTPQGVFVLDSAVSSIKKKTVYNINVKNVHNYYLSGINLANCDEELPTEIYDELQFRLAGTQGYFSMVFTATLGQQYWWRAMECIGQESEALKDAWKRQISMYDCLEYEDGSETPWTVDRIKKVEANCKSKQEVLRRVYGRFIKDEGRKFHAFDPGDHYCKPFQIPPTWNVYVGVDLGSGGDDNHPSAIVFVAVTPEYDKGYIFRGWRGDGVETTHGDVYEKYRSMVGKFVPVSKKYDWAAKDFGTITDRLGDSFEKAEKSQELGEDIVNTLFRNNMLYIFDDDELRKLGVELLQLQKSTPKTRARDDFCDAMRYAVVDIPWNFAVIQEKDANFKKEVVKKAMPKTEQEWQEYYTQQRRAMFEDETKSDESSDWSDLDQEFNYWNEEYGN